MNRTFKEIKPSLQNLIHEATVLNISFSKGKLKRAAKILMTKDDTLEHSEGMKRAWARIKEEGNHPFLHKFYGYSGHRGKESEAKKASISSKIQRGRKTFLSNSFRARYDS